MATAPARPISRSHQALLLFAFGFAVGYPSLDKLGHRAWGVDCAHPELYLICFFSGATAFISGLVLFLAIATRSLTAKPATWSSSAALSAARTPELSIRNGFANALGWLRLCCIGIIVLAVVDMQRRGYFSFSFGYARPHLLPTALTLLFSEIPIALVLLRTWKIPDHPGLALGVAAGAVQILFNSRWFCTSVLNLPGAMLSSWAPLHAALGVSLILLAYFCWRASGFRRGDVGLMASVLLGFLAYTVIWRVIVDFLSAHIRS